MTKITDKTTNTVTRSEYDNKYSNKIVTRRLRPDFKYYDSFELFKAVVLDTPLKKTEMTKHDCNATATCFITTRQSCCSRVQKSCMCLSIIQYFKKCPLMYFLSLKKYSNKKGFLKIFCELIWIEQVWLTNHCTKLTQQGTNVPCDSFTYLWSWQSILSILHRGQAKYYKSMCLQCSKGEHHLGILSIDQFM